MSPESPENPLGAEAKKLTFHQSQKQELRRQKLEIQQKRAQQAQERRERKEQRDAQRRENALLKEQLKRDRRKAGRSLNQEIEDALALADITAAQELEQAQDEVEQGYESSEVSSIESSFEDLEEERDFLRHLKQERTESPLRTELLTQCHGENRDSIQKILKGLEKMMGVIHSDKDPDEAMVEHIMAEYYALWERTTHLCFRQAHYAQQRKLTRANILFQLDEEIKQLLKLALQALAKRQKETAAKQRERRQRSDRKRRRERGDPPPVDDLEDNLFENLRDTIRESLRESPSRPRAHSDRGPAPEPPGPDSPWADYPNRAGESRRNYEYPDTTGRADGNPQPHPGRSRADRFSHAASGTQAQNGDGYPHRQRTASATTFGYTPHYLRPTGEGASFYTSLPPPWNQPPEHTPTPMSEIPQMQKAGYFIHFDGTLPKYRHFRSSMLTACHGLDIPISAKYLLMRSCLVKHRVLEELINTTHPGEDGYRQLILTLEERYGHDNLHINFHLDRLQQAPKVRENNLEDLDDLLDIVRGYETSLPPGARRVNDPTYFAIVKTKLTDRQRRDYARHVRDDGLSSSHCDTSHLLRWIRTYLAEPLRLEPPTRKTTQAEARSGNRQRHLGSGHQPGPYEGENKFQFFAGGSCDACKKPHPLEACPEFKRLPLSKKYDVLKAGGSCFKCLGKNHMASECTQPATCKKCSGTHHPLLHWERRKFDTNKLADNSQRRVSFAAPMTGANAEALGPRSDHMPSAEELLSHALKHSQTNDSCNLTLASYNPDCNPQSNNKSFNQYMGVTQGQVPISLSFQTIKAINPVTGTSKMINALVDGGAQFCAISNHLAKVLGLQGKTATSQVEGVGGLVQRSSSLYAQLVIVSQSGLLRQTLQVRTLDKPVGTLRATNWELFKSSWPHISDISFVEPVSDGEVDMIIGADRADLLTPLIVRHGSHDSPTAMYTPLGWTATGPLYPEHHHHTQVRALCTQDLVEPGGEIPGPELMGVLLNAEDRQAMKLMFTHSKRLPSGHYQVPVLWKGDQRPPNNRVEALKEWKRNLARLKDTGLHEEFDKIIKHWLEEGYVEKLPSKAVLDKEAFYLPYFAVLRPDKQTSRVRIVMNGRAKFGKEQISLNDCVSKGPKIINNLVEVLLRFRQHPIAVSCDIKEMFLRVFMPPEDRCWHRFFYTAPEEKDASVYQANVHQFGSAGSPSSSSFPVKFHALKREPDYPRASPAMIHKTLMDDGLCPEKTSEEARQLVQEITGLLGEIGMTAHKWASNDPSVLPPGTPQRDSIDLRNPDMNEWAPTDMGALLDQTHPESKALGITWSTVTDELSFSSLRLELPQEWTKRSALACLMSFYSPDGLGLPLEMRGRFLFRQTWELGLQWKDPLPAAFCRKWTNWFHAMGHVPFIKYPRSVGSDITAIFIFCDASGEGYGACAYVRTELGHHLVLAKGKIVKSISQSTSVLELEACMVGYSMIPKLIKVYQLTLDKIHFLTDSTNALNWILSPGRCSAPPHSSQIGDSEGEHYITKLASCPR